MQHLIRRIRGLRLFGPVYASHYVPNLIGYFFKAIDLVFRSKLADRWKTARLRASVDAFVFKKGPFSTRAIWQEFKKEAS